MNAQTPISAVAGCGEHLAKYNRSPEARARSSQMASARNASATPPRKRRKLSNADIRVMQAFRRCGLSWRMIGRVFRMSAKAATHQFRRHAGVTVARDTFDRLNAASQSRPLTKMESMALERAMHALGMIA
ncbi:hypothetical protein [Sphingomonas crocodyli]|uniref:Uncharacterized protein n=1 Tax=Sphingomonas crocodyli TaxID=1979270 RepID=A0A437M808_9SPHN|nr:hypothetical protein [Sphingomonas crocodyli]RVT93717.1 hypothetical protein EOD43_07580 [Sphingomonas crocodyli]